jgi:hypothetical protein
MQRAYSSKWGLAGALALSALLLGASGCGDTDDRPVSWSYISATIIQPNCATSRCHSEGAAVKGLVLDTAKGGYEQLSGYTSFDPDNGPDGSGLMYRLNGSFPGSPDVQRMPVDEPLPQADIDLIRKWIAAGALNN